MNVLVLDVKLNQMGRKLERVVRHRWQEMLCTVGLSLFVIYIIQGIPEMIQTWNSRAPIRQAAKDADHMGLTYEDVLSNPSRLHDRRHGRFGVFLRRCFVVYRPGIGLADGPDRFSII